MLEASAVDVARAARLVAAISAGDQPGTTAVFNEANSVADLRGLALALAVRHAQVAGEYYDVDKQRILDQFALDAMVFAENADE